MIHEFRQFIPVNTPLGDGWLLYVTDTGWYSNAIYAVVCCSDGRIRFMTDAQFTVYPNHTAGIAVPEKDKA
jgi:hypothetical protein